MPRLNATQVDALSTELDRLAKFIDRETAAYRAYLQARGRRQAYAVKMDDKRGRLLETMAKQRTPRGNRGAAMHAAYAARRAAAAADDFLNYARYDDLRDAWDLKPLNEAREATRETLHWLDIVAQE